VKVQALTLRSEMGLVGADNADNRVSGAGAMWDFDSQLEQRVLPPGVQTATPKQLRFKLTDVGPLNPPGDDNGEHPYVQLRLKILAPHRP
jgi:hypothetical protein